VIRENAGSCVGRRIAGARICFIHAAPGAGAEFETKRADNAGIDCHVSAVGDRPAWLVINNNGRDKWLALSRFIFNGGMIRIKHSHSLIGCPDHVWFKMAGALSMPVCKDNAGRFVPALAGQ
ncbi:hypothetical protein BAV0990, partial [Bordetella avium 197N]